jgi:streptomycin 6-kinase
LSRAPRISSPSSSPPRTSGSAARRPTDLYHHNVLAARREPWLALDLKSVLGELAYDTAALLRNPVEVLGAPRTGEVLERRIELLSPQSSDSTANGCAGLAQAVLAAYWGFEDGGRAWDEALVFAELLSALRD